jgi:hypothetical protein
MHGDAASSDTTPLAGPGAGPLSVTSKTFLNACSTVLIRSDSKPFVLCTTFFGRDPIVRLLNKNNGNSLADITLSSSSLLGGVYAYLDSSDRMIMVDGSNNIVRIKASKKRVLWWTTWELSIDQSDSIDTAVTGHCGSAGCDGVVAIAPGLNNNVWFVTASGKVGILNNSSKAVSSIALPAGETINNSFSTLLDGRAAIATSKALYLLQESASAEPELLWRETYDAGSARKPGQLSWGTGATPTFFGPTDGEDFVMITDNADNGISLLVHDTDDGSLICQQPIFASNNSGTENSAIGVGNIAIVASTYGYPYPAYPEGAGDSVPASADFIGGMVRVDVRDDRSGCDIVWQNDVRSSAVPKLHVGEELIYTVERKPGGFLFDSFHFSVIDPHSGALLQQTEMGNGDTLQMAGNCGTDGVYWQGTMFGIQRIAPE